MKYAVKILDSGMTIVLSPTKNTNLICMGFFIRAGSRDESDENNGIAHFLEHMMFKGTQTRKADVLLNELDSINASYNATTSMQSTSYYAYTNASNTKKLLDIMLDIYMNSIFDKNEIAREKKVIVEEIRMYDDEPMQKLLYQLHRVMFAGTPLSRPVAGTEDIVTAFKRQDFVKFKSEMYTPENTIFVVTGNFNPVVLYNILVKVFKSNNIQTPNKKNYESDKSMIIDNMHTQNQPYVYIKRNNLFKQAYVLMAFPIYDLYNTKYKQITLLTHLLTHGFSSRLYVALREENGITYGISAYPIVYSNAGVYVIQFVINPVEFVKAIKILMRQLKILKQELISNAEMTKIVNYTKTDAYKSNSPINMLFYYGVNLLTNPNFKPQLKQNIEDYGSVTRNQIKDIANEIFVRDKLNMFVYGNIDITNFDFINL